jgi:hypothetical protein
MGVSGEKTRLPAFHSLSSRFHVLTFHFPFPEFQFTLTTKELSYPEPSVPLPVECSSGWIACGTSKSADSGYQLTNVFIESGECALPCAVAHGILVFNVPKFHARAVAWTSPEISPVLYQNENPPGQVTKCQKVRGTKGAKVSSDQLPGEKTRWPAPHPRSPRPHVSTRHSPRPESQYTSTTKELV